MLSQKYEIKLKQEQKLLKLPAIFETLVEILEA